MCSCLRSPPGSQRVVDTRVRPQATWRRGGRRRWSTPSHPTPFHPMPFHRLAGVSPRAPPSTSRITPCDRCWRRTGSSRRGEAAPPPPPPAGFAAGCSSCCPCRSTTAPMPGRCSSSVHRPPPATSGTARPVRWRGLGCAARFLRPDWNFPMQRRFLSRNIQGRVGSQGLARVWRCSTAVSSETPLSLSRRARSLPATLSGFGTHGASMTPVSGRRHPPRAGSARGGSAVGTAWWPRGSRRRRGAAGGGCRGVGGGGGAPADPGARGDVPRHRERAGSRGAKAPLDGGGGGESGRANG
eukprot:COSAG01_NODE_6710_length_3533_cov_13.464764_2_plen_298_part_00